jgi:hypothetical protein
MQVELLVRLKSFNGSLQYKHGPSKLMVGVGVFVFVFVDRDFCGLDESSGSGDTDAVCVLLRQPITMKIRLTVFA